MNTQHSTLQRALATLPENLRRALLAEARKFANTTNAGGWDFDDLMSIGFLLTERASTTFKPEFGVPLEGYVAHVVVRRRFIDFVRSQLLRTGLDLEGPFAEKASRAHHATTLCQDVNDVISKLLRSDPKGELKREAFALYHLQNYTLKDLSVRYDASVSTIHRWVKQAEGEFRRLWKQDQEND